LLLKGVPTLIYSRGLSLNTLDFLIKN